MYMVLSQAFGWRERPPWNHEHGSFKVYLEGGDSDVDEGGLNCVGMDMHIYHIHVVA